MQSTHLDSISYQNDRVQVVDSHRDKLFSEIQDTPLNSGRISLPKDFDAKLQADGVLPKVDLYDSSSQDSQALKNPIVGTIDEAKIAGTTVGNDQLKPVHAGDSVDPSLEYAFTAAGASSGGSDILSASAFAPGSKLTPADKLAIELSKEVVKGVGNAFKEAWFGTPETEEQAQARYEAEQAKERADQAEARRREEEQRLYYQREQNQYNA